MDFQRADFLTKTKKLRIRAEHGPICRVVPKQTTDLEDLNCIVQRGSPFPQFTELLPPRKKGLSEQRHFYMDLDMSCLE